MIVHPENAQDRDGTAVLPANVHGLFSWLCHFFADKNYASEKLKAALEGFGKWTIEIVKRFDPVNGFVLLPRRWVVQRAIAWLSRSRVLAKDVKATVESLVT